MIEIKGRTMAEEKSELLKCEEAILRLQERVRLGDWKAEIDMRCFRPGARSVGIGDVLAKFAGRLFAEVSAEEKEESEMDDQGAIVQLFEMEQSLEETEEPSAAATMLDESAYERDTDFSGEENLERFADRIAAPDRSHPVDFGKSAIAAGEGGYELRTCSRRRRQRNASARSC